MSKAGELPESLPPTPELLVRQLDALYPKLRTPTPMQMLDPSTAVLYAERAGQRKLINELLQLIGEEPEEQ